MKINLDADKIFVANRAVDFRKEIDGLAALVVEIMQRSPTDGIFIFYNKARNKLKVLGWHGNGFALLYKRLDTGKFFVREQNENIMVDSNQLNWLIAGLDWELLSGATVPKFSTFF